VCHFPLVYVGVLCNENGSVNVAESDRSLVNMGVRAVRGLNTEAFYPIKYFNHFTRWLQKCLVLFFISLLQCHLNNVREGLMCRDSSVGIAVRYGLKGSGIESRCGRVFLHTSRPTLGPTQPPLQWVSGKVAGALC